VGLFAIVPCICTESSFSWTQTNAQTLGQMSVQLRAVNPQSCELAIDPEPPSITVANSDLTHCPVF